MAALAEVFPKGRVERASIDEVYVDVTDEIDRLLSRASGAAEKSQEESPPDAPNDAASADADAAVARKIARGVSASGFVRTLDVHASVFDRRLALGAEACARAREAVFQSTGYTMSGGVAHNKMLAKLASARNKPDKQTVVSRAAVPDMMRSVPLRSIKGLGGKLGERVERALVASFGAGGSNAREATERSGRDGGCSDEGGFTADSLRILFAEEGTARTRAWRAAGFDEKTTVWLRRVSRGEDIDPVLANAGDGGSKSVTAFKSFSKIFDFESLKARNWLRVLSFELCERLVEDRARLSRLPRGMRLEYRAESNARANPPRATSETRSKSFPFPVSATKHLTSGDYASAGVHLTAAAVAAFESVGAEHAFPCTRVGLAAVDFVRAPDLKSDGRGGIEKFFLSRTEGESALLANAPIAAAADRNQDAAMNCPSPKPHAALPRKGALDGFFKRVPGKARVGNRVGNRDGNRDGDGDDGIGDGDVSVTVREDDSADETVRAILASAVRDGARASTFDAPGDVAPFDAPLETELDSRSPGSIRCPRCGARVSAGRAAQSHADEHFAFDLARSEPQHRVAAKTSRGARMGGAKRRREERTGAVSATLFFAKKN
jgi:nucleotidyltransferase/DNA polymerase involved in DNA repair